MEKQLNRQICCKTHCFIILIKLNLLNIKDLINLMHTNNYYYDIVRNTANTLDFRNLNLKELNIFNNVRIFPNLKKLHLSGHTKLTNTGITNIINYNNKINELTLSRSKFKSFKNVTDTGIVSITTLLPNLTSLNLSGCYKITDIGVTAIATNYRSKNLKYLNLSRCTNITDIGVSVIANNLFKLEELNLAGANYPCLTCTKNITDIGIIAIAYNLYNLKSLNLSGNNKITKVGLNTLFESKNMLNLTSLNLNGFNYIEDDCVEILVTNLKHLKHLNLSMCDNITYKSAFAIATNLPCLTSLDLSMCNNITDKGVFAIANNLPYLTSLNLSMCDNITKYSIEIINIKLPNINYLNFAHCRHLQ